MTQDFPRQLTKCLLDKASGSTTALLEVALKVSERGNEWRMNTLVLGPARVSQSRPHPVRRAAKTYESATHFLPIRRPRSKAGGSRRVVHVHTHSHRQEQLRDTKRHRECGSMQVPELAHIGRNFPIGRDAGRNSGWVGGGAGFVPAQS